MALKSSWDVMGTLDFLWGNEGSESRDLGLRSDFFGFLVDGGAGVGARVVVGAGALVMGVSASSDGDGDADEDDGEDAPDLEFFLIEIGAGKLSGVNDASCCFTAFIFRLFSICTSLSLSLDEETAECQYSHNIHSRWKYHQYAPPSSLISPLLVLNFGEVKVRDRE